MSRWYAIPSMRTARAIAATRTMRSARGVALGEGGASLECASGGRGVVAPESKVAGPRYHASRATVALAVALLIDPEAVLRPRPGPDPRYVMTVCIRRGEVSKAMGSSPKLS